MMLILTMNVLANTPPPDTLISGDWLIKIIGAIFTGAALVLGRYWGRKEAASEERSVTFKPPVPTVTTREEPKLATRLELDDHVGWTRNEFARVWVQFSTERTIDNEELNKIHERINQQAMATASLKGSVEEIGKNVSQLLHLSLHGKTPPRSPR